jgi:formate dehydrogenase major subunit
MLRAAVPSPGLARSDWQILVDLSQYFDRPLEYGQPEEIWEDIRASTPTYAGIAYADIGPRGTRADSSAPAIDRQLTGGRGPAVG